MLDSTSDAELLIAISGGDREAVGKLYDRFVEVMMAVGVRLLGDAAEAEDAIHDVFLEVWRSAAAYDEARGSVQTWILVRMRSRCLDRLRRKARRAAEALQSAPVEEAFSGPDAPDRRADHARIRRTIAALPEHLREVLLLSYFHGMSSSEVAESISLPIGTVKSRLAAARRELRTQLVPPPEPRRE